ncbi:MAG: HutD family protein [Crocinitomicaceae bacterium]
MKIIKGTEVRSKSWGGGNTTELYIYPIGSSYINKDFKFRLSKATIEIEESSFTKLNAVKRELMVLKGKLNLIHENKYKILLKPFESDKFNGHWLTTSNGLAEDFNLMMLGNTEGYLEHISSEKSNKVIIEKSCDIIAVFCANGSASLNFENLAAEDLAVIEPSTKQIELILQPNTNLIIVRIWLNN